MLGVSKEDLILLNPIQYPTKREKKEWKLIKELHSHLTKHYPDELKQYRDDDNMLWRFLRAKNLSVKEAAKMYAHTVNWRRDNFIQDFTRMPPPHLVTLCKMIFPEDYLGETSDGKPVYLSRLQNWSYAEAKERLVHEDVRQWHVLRLEEKERKLRELTLITGDWQDSLIHIIDLKGISPLAFKSFVSSFKMKETLTLRYYPEIYEKILIINTPYLYMSLIKLLGDVGKRLLMTGKLVVAGPKETPDKLKESIPIENLPKAYGGQAEDLENPSHDWRLFDLRLEKTNDIKFEKLLHFVDVKNGFKFTKNTRVMRGMLLEWRYRSTKKAILFTCRPETRIEEEARHKAVQARSQSMGTLPTSSFLDCKSPIVDQGKNKPPDSDVKNKDDSPDTNADDSQPNTEDKPAPSSFFRRGSLPALFWGSKSDAPNDEKERPKMLDQGKNRRSGNLNEDTSNVVLSNASTLNTKFAFIFQLRS